MEWDGGSRLPGNLNSVILSVSEESLGILRLRSG